MAACCCAFKGVSALNPYSFSAIPGGGLSWAASFWPPASFGLSVIKSLSGGVGVDGEYTVTSVTATTFVATSTSLNTSGAVDIYLPIDYCFYLVKVSTVTNTNQFFPLFVANIESIEGAQYCSLTSKELLPFINNPAVHAGANFSSANSTIAPKLRGLILPSGSALYASVSGATSLTNGFYINVQGGYY